LGTDQINPTKAGYKDKEESVSGSIEEATAKLELSTNFFMQLHLA